MAIADRSPSGGRPLLRSLPAADAPGYLAADARAADALGYLVADRTVLDAVGVALYTTDAQGRIDYFNEAATELWGRRPELGEMWCGSFRLMWIDGTPMSHDQCPMAIALREDRPVRGMQAMAERPDGRIVVFQPFPTPLHDADGRLVGAVNVMVDVTERARAEQALRVSNAVKDEFLGLISHEMRTPVTTILGNARLLIDRADRLGETDRQHMLADISHDADRLNSIIENLLMLTRLEAGVQPEFEPQVLAHVVRSALNSYRARHAGRTIMLTSEPRHIIVEADRSYLEMLLENLLSNADKYSPQSETVEVLVRSNDLARTAEVLIRDRGIGLPEGDDADIFAPFYRAPAARNRAAGVGIGLSVCRRLVEAQGGRMWAVRRDGGGSELGFSLPLAPEPGEVPADGPAIA